MGRDLNLPVDIAGWINCLATDYLLPWQSAIHRRAPVGSLHFIQVATKSLDFLGFPVIDAGHLQPAGDVVRWRIDMAEA